MTEVLLSLISLNSESTSTFASECSLDNHCVPSILECAPITLLTVILCTHSVVLGIFATQEPLMVPSSK